MSFKFNIALAASATSTWALKGTLHRPAANFPGKVGLIADPQLIRDLRPRIRKGSIVVVGTNGKTTVTNMLADILEASGFTVACNRTGANLDSGIATALLQAKDVDWGVLECDELWLAKVAPQLQPDYLVLLNLFRDQLDRMGEIEHIQGSIAEALASSPNTVLLYNCDDPLCQAIAEAAENRSLPFGIADDLGLAQNAIADAGLCQKCGQTLEYTWRQYGQLGSYRCPSCGFARAEPAFAAHNITLTSEGVSLAVHEDSRETEEQLSSGQIGAYTVYNVLAACAAAHCCDVPPDRIASTVRSFSPENGRQQRYEIDGCGILLNLAKNPTGFNQNLRIVQDEQGPVAVAFFVNDKEADGRDVSWLWDVDFQELASCENIAVFAGGTRRNDVQVRLKYAGIRAPLVDGAADFITQSLEASPNARLFLIANYTALPAVKAELDRLENLGRLPLPARQVERSLSGSGAPSVADIAPEADVPSTADAASAAGVPSAADTTSEADAPTAADAAFATDAPSAADAASAAGVPSAADIVSAANAASGAGMAPAAHPTIQPATETRRADDMLAHSERLVIAHLFPELLNLYGDGGNVTVLQKRAEWRGISTEIVSFESGDELDFSAIDIVFLGGGPDNKQRLASRELLEQATALRTYIQDDGVLLAICGGYQILGSTWVLGDGEVEGLGILDIETKRAERGSHDRLVGNIALRCSFAHTPVVGYENHAGRTILHRGCQPFGSIIGRHGKGNDGKSGADGALYRNVVATYLHGPLLAKNPEVADFLIERALERRAAKEGRNAPALPPLDNKAELEANAYMCQKLGIHLT